MLHLAPRFVSTYRRELQLANHGHVDMQDAGCQSLHEHLFPTRFARARNSTINPLLRPCFRCRYLTAVSLAAIFILAFQRFSTSHVHIAYMESMVKLQAAVRKLDFSAVATPMAVIMDLGHDE